MKIAIASVGKEKTSFIDRRFGRCAFFQIIDLDRPEEIKVIDNQARSAQRGAGIVAVRLVADQGAKKVIAGNFGPNAMRALKAAGVEPLIESSQMSVKQVLKKYQGGKEK